MERNKKNKDYLINAAGVILFLSSFLLYEYYVQNKAWDSFYYIKDYVIVALLFYYGVCTATKPITKIVSLFSLIFVIFKAIYEMAVFYEVTDLNEDTGIQIFYFTYAIFVWVMAMWYILKKTKKKWKN